MARAFGQPPPAVIFLFLMLGMYVGHLRTSSRGPTPFQRRRWEYDASLIEQQQQQQQLQTQMQAEALHPTVTSNGGPEDPGGGHHDQLEQSGAQDQAPLPRALRWVRQNHTRKCGHGAVLDT